MLERAERKGHEGRIAELSAQLACPPFPEPLSYIWGTFWRLRRRIKPGESGPNPITWVDLESYCRMTSDRLAPWEVGLIEQLDDLYLTASAEAIRQARNPETTPVSEAGLGALTRDMPRRVVSRDGEQPHD